MNGWKQQQTSLASLTMEKAEERIAQKKQQMVELEQEIEMYKIYCAEIVGNTYPAIPAKYFEGLLKHYDYANNSTKHFTKEDRLYLRDFEVMLFGADSDAKLISLGDVGFPTYGTWFMFKLNEDIVQIHIPDFSVSNSLNYKLLEFSLAKKNISEKGCETWVVLKKTRNLDEFISATKQFAMGSDKL